MDFLNVLHQQRALAVQMWEETMLQLSVEVRGREGQ